MTQSDVLNYTSRLLNYVEPYYIDGVAKSAFYTEVNTNLTKHSKAFILNGYHDSEVFISKGKYAKNADGYKVLYVDKCKVVLDIDFNGITQSFKEDEFDKCIKVYHVRSQREFDYLNKIFVDSYSNQRVSKFEKGYTNNIIYSDEIFLGTSSGIGVNSGLNNIRQFWARTGTSWIDVTNTFNYNIFTFSSDYYATGLTNNGRIYIVGEDINYLSNTYKQRNVYKFTDPSSPNSWEIDITHKAPIITKLNFRQGIFRGTHNDGIFGSYLNEENWYGTQSKWTSGFFVNGNWVSGSMKSKSSALDASYYTTIENGLPIQTTDFSNNKGFGYNYILDSNIYSGEIENGNFINCNVGPTNSGLTAINEYFGITNSFSLIAIGGLYNYCDVKNTKISNSTTLDSIIENCYLSDTKTLNSQLTESYSRGGEFNINGGISVISADIISYIPNNSSGTTSSSIRGALKLYISDKDYSRLDTFDNFYITKINKDYIISSLDSDQKILLPYETRYILDSFWNFKISGSNQDCFGSLKSKFDNIYKVHVNFNSPNYVNNISINDNYYASIDIDLGAYLAFQLTNIAGSHGNGNEDIYFNQNIIKKDNVQNLFLKTYVSNSDFRNGVINEMKWTSGSNVNYPSNIIKVQNGVLKITKVSTNEIEIYLNEPVPTINDNQLKINSYVWLDSIYAGTSSISGVYKISSASYSVTNTESSVILSNSTIISPISISATFSVPDSLPKYASINKLLIDSSEVNSGLFERTLFKNSIFINDEFNNLDKNITNSNIEKLRLINLIFKDNNNTIKNGLIHKSHILDVNWISGISNNSIWKGPTFGGGVFNLGYWENGVFNDGIFQNSRGITISSIDYSSYQHYKNWLDGTFNNGIFYNSVWLDGTFNNGKFYNSDWYGGIWNNGILGDKNVPTMNTSMGKLLNLGIGSTQTFWYNGIVENAQVGGDGIVYWYDGKFNNGRFSSNDTKNTKESIWYDGEFNGGDFSDLARWKNGIFNKGKFRSYYGWTMSSSTYSTDYSWENGKFNGGQFGIGEYATNSTWFNGEFNGGIFQGRIWNNGIFGNGNFNGGSTYSVILDESLFTESFTQSYYGLWRNGWVTNIKHKAITNELISANNLRNDQKDVQKFATLKNILWINGYFDHPSGSIDNSAWLSGSFKKGNFNGVFNPYVNRSWFDSSYGTYSTFNTSFGCIWENGIFNNGIFYISDWKNGRFLNGTMSGSRWINGIWEYGYAKNIYWTGGIWKNGMWDGSPFSYKNLLQNNDMKSDKDRDILLRVSNVLRNGKLHLINAFTGSSNSEILRDSDFQNVNQFFGWTFSDTGSLTDWIPSTDNSGVYLNSGVPSTPVINGGLAIEDFPSTGLIQRDFVIGPVVTEGDKYSISVQYYYNPNVVHVGIGTVTITAVSGDNSSTIAQKLSDKINDGLTQNVVEYYDPLVNYFTWGYFDNNVVYPQSSYVGDTITIITKDYCSSNGYTTPGSYVGSYNESEVLYALSNGFGYSPSPTTSVFTQSLSNHSITLNVSNLNGRTDFIVYIGSDSYRETINGNISKTYNYNYVPQDDITLPQEFAIKRVFYFHPNNSRFFVNSASVRTIDASYSSYNNKLYQFATFSSPFLYGVTGASVSIPDVLIPYVVADREIVSLKFGNGVFKSGIWESGYWNNGWRSVWNDSENDFIVFTNISVGSTLEISPNLWNVKLLAFDGTNGLSIGDKVSIGNIVCIDVNENRRLINNYFRIISIDSTSITVEISLNMSVRRIIKDSDYHMMYVSTNVWLSGVFYNGYFRGIWNYGLFKGYPYITKMEGSHWIDGVFDGGKFASTQSQYLDKGLTLSYNTGLIQNFTFRDNNVASQNEFLYNSWIDVNYITYSMTNIFKDNMRYNYDYDVIISDGNLKGFPTYDVLSSESIFRNSFDLDYKYYKLGSKYKIYVDFIGDSSYFNYPLKTDGIPGPSEFMINGWTYSANSSKYHSNTDPFLSDSNELVLEYAAQSYTNTGIKAVQTKKIRYRNTYDELVTPAGGHNSAGSLIRDYSDTASGNYEFHYQEIGGVDLYPSLGSKRFSNLSYTASNWQFYNNQYLSPSIDTYPVTLRDYPSGVISGFNNNNLFGNTIVEIRRSYMMDWFDLSSLDSQYDGYDNPGVVSNSYSRFGQTSSFGTFSFYAYRATSTTTLRVNAFVPFTFYGNERYYNSAHRGGWSTFKFVGVVERCGTSSNPYIESNWQYVTSTKLDYYGNSGNSNVNQIAMDKDKCCIVFDGNLPGGSFIGKLYISNINIQVNAGELIRFRLYWIDIRKMFSSAGGGVSGQGPGQFELSIGVDPSMGYTENNHGYFEIIDTSTYYNTNTNLLDNTYSRNIEKFRYSVIDFDLNTYGGIPYQGPTGSALHDLPTIYLLNDNPKFTPGNFSTIINHAITDGVNKKEYFYNRKALQLFFKSTDTFDAHFGKISFYETDMIPFFRYTTEDNVDNRIKRPFYGIAPFIAVNSSITLDSITQSSG